MDVHPTTDRVVFSATLNESGPPSQVVVVDVTGEDRRVLDQGPYPVWSPDGGRLAWWRYGSTALVVSDLQGEATQVGEPFGFGPQVSAWSPDGSAVLVTPRPTHDNAFLVDVADALAAGSVVAVDGGPALLTAPISCRRPPPRPSRTWRSATSRSWAAAIGPGVVEELEELGYVVRRIGGSTRVETAARAAALLPGADVALLASGDPFPDALALGPLAVAARAPILLGSRHALPAATAEVLAEQRPDRLLVAGGTAAITDGVVRDAEAACGCAAERLSGSDRTATAVAVAEELERLVGTPGGVFLVAGDRFPDALAAAAAAGRAGRPLLLAADRATLTTSTRDHLARLAGAITRIDVIGDETVVAETTVTAARDAATSPGA